MTQLAIQIENRYSPVAGYQSPVNKSKLNSTPLLIEAVNAFNTPDVCVPKPNLAIVSPKEKRKTSYLASKRNLLFVTIAYTIVLCAIISMLL